MHSQLAAETVSLCAFEDAELDEEEEVQNAAATIAGALRVRLFLNYK